MKCANCPAEALYSTRGTTASVVTYCARCAPLHLRASLVVIEAPVVEEAPKRKRKAAAPVETPVEEPVEAPASETVVEEVVTDEPTETVEEA